MSALPNYYQVLYNCPVVELSGYTARHNLAGHIFAYLDFGGPTGTAKDGLAEGMLALALQQGKLQKRQSVLEIGSGAFSVALCIAARRSGHSVYLIVSPTLDAARKKFLQDLGAQLIPCMDVLYGRREAMYDFARKTAERKYAYFLDRFNNDDNPEYHRRLTGPAILKATNGGNDIDAIVAGIGTGGTFTGVGEHIKAWTNHIRMVAVEPYESQALSGGFIGRHNIPGLGAGFVPENYNPYVTDRVMAISSGDAAAAAKDVLLSDAIPACTSAGATLYAARQLLEDGISKSALCIFSGRETYG